MLSRSSRGGVAVRPVGVHQRHLYHGTRLKATTTFMGRSAEDVHVPAEQDADEGE